jgi:multicomponent Na+:H+ antiporter subunit F
MNVSGIASTASLIALAMLSVALLFAFVRLVHGPSLPDRGVALDRISIRAAGVTAVYAIAAEQAVFLDVAIILALMAFLGTVAFARYLEKQVAQ